jgi:hypothetical protein
MILIPVIVILSIIYVLLLGQGINYKARRIFESCSILLIIILAVVESGNLKLISICGAFILGSTIALREFYNNFVATVYMFFVPIYDHHSILKFPQTKLGLKEVYVYNNLGFLRSKVSTAEGDVVYVPNRILLNDAIEVE